MSPTGIEIAWIAGLLEGEGSFGLGAVSQGKRGGELVRQLRITCAMTDEDTIEKLHRLCGGTRNKESRLDPRRSYAKPLYVWNLTRRKEVVALLECIRPHMSERRGLRIDELLQYNLDHPLKYKGLIHGTRNSYKWYNCRCTECRKAVADYARNHRQAKKAA